MKLFLDTANIEEVREIAGWGILDGVTTNPSLVAKEKGDYRSILKAICNIVKGPVSGEVISLNSEAMIREATDLAALSEYMVIKVPCTVEGLKAARALETGGIHVNMTLVFSANQALLAAKAGASYISPFVGRLDDIGNPGIDIVQDILSILETYGFASRVIFASVRHPEHVRQAALCGCHIATIPHKVFTQLVRHPLTDTGIERFLKDWQSR
jgi:transaldolase